MRCYKSWALFISCFVSLVGVTPRAAGGWGPQGCAPVGRVSVPQTPVYSWRLVSGTEHALYRNGVQVANYDTATDTYRELRSDGTWGPVVHGKFTSTPHTNKPTACRCDPCDCDPCKCGPESKVFFGVDSSQLHKDGVTRHYVNGKQVPRHEAMAALKLDDDSAKPFITFIGEGREALASAFSATPDSAKIRINSYPADAWQVKPGFVTTGKPTVYVQKPTGEVTFRNVDGKAPTLEKLVAEARKAQPDYDPAKDGDGSGFQFDYKKYLAFLPYVVGTVVLVSVLRAYKKG